MHQGNWFVLNFLLGQTNNGSKASLLAKITSMKHSLLFINILCSILIFEWFLPWSILRSILNWITKQCHNFRISNPNATSTFKFRIIWKSRNSREKLSGIFLNVIEISLSIGTEVVQGFVDVNLLRDSRCLILEPEYITDFSEFFRIFHNGKVHWKQHQDGNQ